MKKLKELFNTDIDIKKKKRYMLPLLLLPFLLIFAYVISNLYGSNSSSDTGASLEKKEELNSSLPDPVPGKDLNKFEAYQDKFKRQKSSGIMGITPDEMEEEVQEPELEIKTNPEIEQIEEAQEKSVGEAEKLKRLQEKYLGGNNSQENLMDNKNLGREPKSKQMEDLESFKAQLALIDSVQNMKNPKTKKVEPTQQPVIIEEETLLARKADSPGAGYFNTIKANKSESFISAILDEAQTVKEGSRIRIRLMDDIFIGDQLLKKGTYLYGNVRGFSSQRVHVDINSVLIGNQILKTKINLYDNDGIIGLYVPSSDFREIMQNAGSQVANQQVSINSSDNSAFEQFTYGALQNIYRSATQAISQKIKQNKAKFKYSTVVYLINEDEQNK